MCLSQNGTQYHPDAFLTVIPFVGALGIWADSLCIRHLEDLDAPSFEVDLTRLRECAVHLAVQKEFVVLRLRKGSRRAALFSREDQGNVERL